MSKIFFPLRSNSAWFLKDKTKNALERRIKTCLMLYDEVLFQNFLYKCTIWENGALDMLLPPSSIGFDRKKINYFKPGAKAGLFIGPTGSEERHQIISGEAKISYHVDYYPIIHEAELLSADYINFIDIDVNQKGKNKAKEAAKVDDKKLKTAQILGENKFFREKILESLYIDSMLSLHVRAPFIIDFNAGPITKFKLMNELKVHEGAIKDIFFNNWIGLGLPDFGLASWEEIDKLRQSSAGVELRKMLERIINEVSNELPNISNYNDLMLIIERLFTKEIINELVSKIPSSKGTFFNIGLNLIPYGIGSVTGGFKDIIKLVLDRRSWISLLKPK